jgi:hypothetical protein
VINRDGSPIPSTFSQGHVEDGPIGRLLETQVYLLGCGANVFDGEGSAKAAFEEPECNFGEGAGEYDDER